jgi:OMF family outer membrane factor
VNRVEVMRAEVAVVRAEQQLEEAGYTRDSAYRSLTTILASPGPWRVTPPVELPADATADGERSDRALRLRPELAQLERTIIADEAQAKAAAFRWLPTLSAFGDVRAYNYKGFSGNPYEWAVGGQLDWTIYDGGLRDASRHLARAQQHEAEAQLSLLRDQVGDQVRDAQQALATKRRALEAAERSRDLSSETLDLVRTQYDAGTATQLDVLQGQDSLIVSEVNVAQARFDLALSYLSLRRATGDLPTQ